MTTSCIGGTGNDMMYGGAGNDTFYLNAAAGQTDSIVLADTGDHLQIVDVALAIAGTTVGATFDASNNVRYIGRQLQVDLNGDQLFNAAKDFDISLSGVGSVTWDAATQQFGFGALPPRRPQQGVRPDLR